jgi:CRISPR system Cascade subunit CasB
MTPIDQAKIATLWWRGLQPYHANGERNPAADRGALARLRTADLRTAMCEPATFALFRALGRRHSDDLPDVALCAAVLATVRDNREEHPMRTLGAPSIEAADKARMKPLRFRSLIEAEEPDDRLLALRGAVRLAGDALNVRELAAACLDWSERRRQRWTFEFYNAGSAAPAATHEETVT